MEKNKTLTAPPYRASTGNWYTGALFYEKCLHQTHVMRTINPVFSLFEDRPGLINCQTTFVELRDPSGYKWAMKYLGDFRHWERLYALDWFKDAVETWRQNLRLKLQSEALEKIQEIASGDSAQALAAAKYIAEEGWKSAPSTRGRPSKDEVDRNMKRLTQDAKVRNEDAERIGLRLVK